jgi:hypothetical protein
MAEYIDDELLNEVIEDARAAGLDQRATNNLTQSVIRGAISARAAAARQDDAQQARADTVLQKYQLKQQEEQGLRERLLGLAGPAPEEAAPMPITYGANPKTGVRAWNNLGWIADKPEQIAHLDPRQRGVAERYNTEALSQVRGNGANGAAASEPMTFGRQDPFRPPSAVIEQHHARVENNRLMLRKMLDAAQLMTQAKIPAQVQDLVLYQMFPEAARRKLTEDIARLREREAIEGPRKDAALDARLDRDDRQAEYQRETVRLRRSAEHNSKVKALEDLQKAYDAAKSGGRTSPQQLLEMADKISRAQYDLVMNSEAFMHNTPAPYGLPRVPTQDPLAGVTGQGIIPNQYEQNPDWWKSEPGAKTKTQLDRENLANRRLEEVKRNSPGDTATIQRLEREAGRVPAPAATPAAPAANAPRAVRNPDGSHTQPEYATKQPPQLKPGQSRSYDIGGGRKLTIHRD